MTSPTDADNMNFNHLIDKRVRELRKSSGFNTDRFAQDIVATSQTLAEYEAGIRGMYFSQLIPLIRLHNVDINWFYEA